MKSRKPVLSSFYFSLLSVFLLLFSLVYSVLGIFFGIDFTDSFYHLNQAVHPPSGTYPYPFFLSSLLIERIIEYVGKEVIYLRFVNWLLLVSSILLPFIFFKPRRSISEILLYISIILVLYAPFNANILGYDTLSIFILSLIFSVAVLYIKFRKLYYIFLLSLICAAAVMIRLPNALAIPIIFFLLLIPEKRFENWTFKMISRPLIFAVLTFILLLLGYALYYSSWENLVAANPIAESHDLLLLFSNYLRDSVRLIGYCGIILAALWAYRKLKIPAFPLVKEALLVLFFVFFLIFLVGHSKYSGNYSLFLLAVAMAITLKQFYKERREKKFDKAAILLLFLFFLFINPFGSNTGLLKAYSLLVLLPFILSISEVSHKKYWFLLFTILIPFSVFSKVYGIYEDKNLLVLDEKLRLEKLSLIYTNSERAGYLEQVDTIIRNLKLKEVQVYFYGDKAHIFHYLYPGTSLNIGSFHQPVDSAGLLDEMKNKLPENGEIALFVINSYPESVSPGLSLLEQEMKRNGFKKVEEAGVIYYIRPTKSL